MAREQITWPSWFDGGGTGGPIASPTGSAHGPISSSTQGRDPVQGVRGEALDKAVDGLLEEFGLPTSSRPGRPKRPRPSRPPPRPPRQECRRQGGTVPQRLRSPQWNRSPQGSYRLPVLGDTLQVCHHGSFRSPDVMIMEVDGVQMTGVRSPSRVLIGRMNMLMGRLVEPSFIDGVGRVDRAQRARVRVREPIEPRDRFVRQ